VALGSICERLFFELHADAVVLTPSDDAAAKGLSGGRQIEPYIIRKRKGIFYRKLRAALRDIEHEAWGQHSFGFTDPTGNSKPASFFVLWHEPRLSKAAYCCVKSASYALWLRSRVLEYSFQKQCRLNLRVCDDLPIAVAGRPRGLVMQHSGAPQ
jgi:hypothetical protein